MVQTAIKTLSSSALNPPVADTNALCNRTWGNLSICNSMEVLNMRKSAAKHETTRKHFQADECVRMMFGEEAAGV